MKISRNHLMRGYNIFVGDKDLFESEGEEMNYYDLPKDVRWLGDDSPYTIGGRDTDIAQIAYSFEYRVREIYPINGVPVGIVEKLAMLKSKCEDCEREIQNTISLISEDRIRRL